MKVMIVDDEAFARQELRALLEAAGDVEILGEAANAVEAIAAINRLAPEVVFLDIQMPRVTGLELVTMLDPERMPRIVFLTAHEEYALQAFEQHAFDYLLKPADPARLEKTLADLRRDKTPRTAAMLEQAPALRQIPCTGVNRISLVKLADVEYVVARPGGIYVAARDGIEMFTELTMRTLEERTDLVRCHRQYMVNADQIKDIALGDGGGATIATIGGNAVPVSRRYLGPLKERLGFR